MAVSTSSFPGLLSGLPGPFVSGYSIEGTSRAFRPASGKVADVSLHDPALFHPLGGFGIRRSLSRGRGTGPIQRYGNVDSTTGETLVAATSSSTSSPTSETPDSTANETSGSPSNATSGSSSNPAPGETASSSADSTTGQTTDPPSDRIGDLSSGSTESDSAASKLQSCGGVGKNDLFRCLDGKPRP